MASAIKLKDIISLTRSAAEIVRGERPRGMVNGVDKMRLGKGC